MTRKRVVVSGQVQGVFFRDTVRRRAQASGVAGWACNLPGGTVEAVFEADHPEVVDSLVEFCRKGPGRAEVESVEVTEEEPEGLTGFEIR
jgi:acylphosphatase